MFKNKIPAFVLTLAMLFSTFSLAAAEGELAACEGDEVIGSIVSVDQETGQVVIKTETGECYVSIDQEYDHPIVDLFNDYFATLDPASLEAAVAGLQGWATYDEDTLSWQWISEESETASVASLVSFTDNADGTFTLELAVEGQELPVYLTITEAEEIAFYTALFEAASVQFSLTQDEEGNAFIADVGDDVMAYHDDGMGFGVLIKFYSLAAESDLTVEELVSLFKDEKTGLGKIFREYATPSMMGVGHLRQELKNDAESTLESEKRGRPDKQNNGGQPEDKGNNGKGKNKD